MRDPVLPNQNQLYAYYLSRCGHYRVGKPNAHVLELLREDEPSRLIRLTAESKERGVSVASLMEMETEEPHRRDAYSGDAFTPTPLAERETFRLDAQGASNGRPVYVGARGMMPLLDLIVNLPLLRELDLSNVASWFSGDAAAAIVAPNGISGNDVVWRLCEVILQLPDLRTVDISSQPIGCLAAERILEVLDHCPRLRTLRICTEGVDDGLYGRIQRKLKRNAATPLSKLPWIQYPEQLPDYLLALPVIDRKTMREQQMLRALLAEDENFANIIQPEALSNLVLSARVMSMREVVSRCRGMGLRGDGVHLFVIKSGSLRAFMDLKGFRLQRGDYFGDTYDDDLFFPTCRMEEEERGTVFALPLDACADLRRAWGARVRELHERFVSKAALLQPLDAWTRMRISTCCSVRGYAPGEKALVADTAHESFFLVIGDGSFQALPGRGEDKVLTGRYEPYVFEKLDVFGTEALVASRKTSSVVIEAGNDPNKAYLCAVATGAAPRLLRNQLWSVLATSVHAYSLHEDLRQIARKEPEWAYCI